MYGLIEVLYDEDKQKAFEQLYVDSDVKGQFLLRSVLAQSLKDCPKIISSHGTDWILCTLCQFNKDEEDTVRVFQAIMKMLSKVRDIGLLNSNIEWYSTSDIADVTLVNVGLFRQRVEMLHRRRGAPSVDYYSQAGALAFHRLGYEGIAEDFNGWTAFLEKELT